RSKSGASLYQYCRSVLDSGPDVLLITRLRNTSSVNNLGTASMVCSVVLSDNSVPIAFVKKRFDRMASPGQVSCNRSMTLSTISCLSTPGNRCNQFKAGG